MEEKARHIRVGDIEIRISNPNKVLFKEVNMTKWEYIICMSQLCAYLLPYCQNRALTTIRFPHGQGGDSFYQKNIPKGHPNWVHTHSEKDIEYVLLNDLPTLLWLSNLACIEFHPSFNKITTDCPTELVFDLDPSTSDFNKVMKVALYLREALLEMGLDGFVKTSGASGLQVYIPIEWRYTYEDTRKVGYFISKYLLEKYPTLVTMERKKRKRADKVYLDYLQHYRGKTLISAYSPRATKEATVSCPLQWEELLSSALHPAQFTLLTIFDRLSEKGDLFKPLLEPHNRYSLGPVLALLK